MGKDRFLVQEAPKVLGGIVVTIVFSTSVYSREKDRWIQRERHGDGGHSAVASRCHFCDVVTVPYYVQFQSLSLSMCGHTQTLLPNTIVSYKSKYKSRRNEAKTQ